MSKTRATINFIGLFLFIVAIVVLNESIVITEPHLQLTLNKYSFVGGAFLLFIVVIFMWVFTKHKEFLNYKVFLLIVLAFATPLINVFLEPSVISFPATDAEGVTETVSLTIGLFARFQSLFFTLTSILIVYLFFVVVPKLLKTKAMLMGFLYFLIIILVGFIIYSLIVEWDQYYLLFTTGNIDYYTPTISLFSNTNVFGYYLSLGIYVLGILDSLKHRFWHYILIAVFILSLLLTITITSYVGGFVFLTLYVVYDLMIQLKRRPVAASIWFVSLVSLTFVAIVGLMLSDLPLATSIREDFIPESIESLQSRYIIWRHARELYFGLHLYIGHGMGISNSLLRLAMGVEGGYGTNRFHNGVYEIIASGGLYFLLTYLTLVGVTIYFVIKRYKYNRKLALTSLFILLGILIQSVSEAKVLFKGDAMGTLGTFIILIPLLIDRDLIDTRTKVTPIPKVFEIGPVVD
jgi:hypothetical protein